MDPSILKLIDGLRDFRTRSDAKQQLLAFGPAAVEPLIAELRDRAEGVRWAAASLLGQLGDERAIDPLIEALQRPDMAAAAADALRTITGQDFGEDPRRWAAWRRGEPADAPASPDRIAPPLSDAELVRQAIGDLAEELTESGEVFIARLALKDGRHQSVRLNAAHKDSEGNGVILIETVCGPASSKHYEWALRQNLKLPFGAIAIRDIGGQPHFVMVNSLLRQTATPPEIRASVLNIARWGDAIEKALLKEDTR
jgi:hypothetical protein